MSKQTDAYCNNPAWCGIACGCHVTYGTLPGSASGPVDIPFTTTLTEQSNICLLAALMLEADVDPRFVAKTARLAHKDQGVYDLMLLWTDDPDRPATITAIQECIHDWEHSVVTVHE